MRALDRGFPRLATLTLHIRGELDWSDVELAGLASLRLSANLSDEVEREIIEWACAHRTLAEIDVFHAFGKPFALAGKPIDWPGSLRAVRWNANSFEI